MTHRVFWNTYFTLYISLSSNDEKGDVLKAAFMCNFYLMNLFAVRHNCEREITHRNVTICA